jgi:predicted kinase
MPTITVNRGFSGSGKSTKTEKRVRSEKNTVAVNRDYIRKMTAQRWWPANEDLVTDIEVASITSAVNRGLNVIVDDTFLEDKWVEKIRFLSKKLDADFEIDDSFMAVPIDTCIERDAKRERSVGKDVIEYQYFKYWAQKQKPENFGRKQAIIVDIDGTLAHVPGADHITGQLKGRYPYERDMTQDTLDFATMMVVSAMHNTGYEIILVSGRGEEKRAETEQWLARNSVPYDKLYMRAAGDSKRSDVFVKKDIYMDSIQSNYRIEFVLDDRPAVVRMWRAELGLKVLQVAPNIEF